MGSVKFQAQETSMEEIHLMPWPQEIKTNTSDYSITEAFGVFIHGKQDEDSRMTKAAVRFIRYMTDKSGVFVAEGFPNAKGIDASCASLNIYFDTTGRCSHGY